MSTTECVRLITVEGIVICSDYSSIVPRNWLFDTHVQRRELKKKTVLFNKICTCGRVPESYLVINELLTRFTQIYFYQFRTKIRIYIGVARAFRFEKPVSICNYLTLPQENRPIGIHH